MCIFVLIRFLSTLLCIIVSLNDEQLYSWGWRLPFLSGILIAFVGIYLRLYGEESNPHSPDDDEKEDTHWRDVFRKENLPALGAATFTPMVSIESDRVLDLHFQSTYASLLFFSYGELVFTQHLYGWPYSWRYWPILQKSIAFGLMQAHYYSA